MESAQQEFNSWNSLPKRNVNKMVHLGKGYSKLLQSYNQEIFSPDASRNDGISDHDMLHPTGALRSMERELDPKEFDFSCKKLPQIRSSANFKTFDDRP